MRVLGIGLGHVLECLVIVAPSGSEVARDPPREAALPGPGQLHRLASEGKATLGVGTAKCESRHGHSVLHDVGFREPMRQRDDLLSVGQRRGGVTLKRVHASAETARLCASHAGPPRARARVTARRACSMASAG